MRRMVWIGALTFGMLAGYAAGFAHLARFARCGAHAVEATRCAEASRGAPER